jgi:hypothetical protein
MKHGNLMRYLAIAGGGLAVGLLAAGSSWRAALPLVLLLACPLMMLFMMRGMAGHGGRAHQHHRDTHDRYADRDGPEGGRRL